METTEKTRQGKRRRRKRRRKDVSWQRFDFFFKCCRKKKSKALIDSASLRRKSLTVFSVKRRILSVRHQSVGLMGCFLFLFFQPNLRLIPRLCPSVSYTRVALSPSDRSVNIRPHRTGKKRPHLHLHQCLWQRSILEILQIFLHCVLLHFTNTQSYPAYLSKFVVRDISSNCKTRQKKVAFCCLYQARNTLDLIV